jgi:hypothetical protein
VKPRGRRGVRWGEISKGAAGLVKGMEGAGAGAGESATHRWFQAELLRRSSVSSVSR